MGLATADAPSLERRLAELTREGELRKPLPGGRVGCHACGHRCVLADGQTGLCRVRFNQGGRLMVPWGYVSGLGPTPVEQQPFFHVLPGATVYGFSTLGCNYHCAYCHNWQISQALRDDEAGWSTRRIVASEVARLARREGAQIVAAKYNEPLITSEWAAEIFAEAKAQGLITAVTSNGHATREVLAYLRPVLDVFKVDLKSFTEEGYRRLGGSLQTVLATIEQVIEMDFWAEIVTLCVPGFNDSEDELGAMARFLAGLSRGLPWHVIAFHPDYRMQDRPDTPEETLKRAWEIGRAAGLHYVYTGNRPALPSQYQDTLCSACSAPLVERRGFRCLMNHVVAGACPHCATPVPGFWSGQSGQPITVKISN